MPIASVLLLVGVLTIIVNGEFLQYCNPNDPSQPCSGRSSSIRNLWQVSRPTHAHKWYGFRPPPAWYPAGDCATECTRSPAVSMRSCAADAATGIPETSCKALLNDPAVCPTMRYLDAVLPENYCMPRFEADCSHPDNVGCSQRCALYMIINRHCVTDAYDTSTATFNASCQYCNMCWDRSSRGTVAAQKVPYALVWARGKSGALFVNHWLVLPKAPCSGIESTTRGCTDDTGEYLWASAYLEAVQLGFNYSGGPPNWAMLLNAPNRRGVHQMHIHIAHIDSTRSSPSVDQSNWLVRTVAQYEGLSTDLSAPTKILGEGYYNPGLYNSSCTPLHRPPKDWARTYAVFVPTKDAVKDLGAKVKPFELARQLSAASDTPSHGYGLMLMPRKFGKTAGVIIGIVWSTDDWEQLDVAEMQGDPVHFGHTCHNYIGAESVLADGSVSSTQAA